MVAFNKFFSTVLLAVLYASVTEATPIKPSAKHATHRTRHIGRDLNLETYHPKTSFETFGKGIDHPTSLSKRDRGQSAVDFAASKLQKDASSMVYRSGFSRDGIDVAYIKQHVNNIPFANTAANVAFKNDKVISFGSSFVDASNVPDATPSKKLEDILESVESQLQGKYNNHPSSLEYFVKSDNSIALTHVVQIQDQATNKWYEAFVDAHSGELVSVTDFVADATYTVLPINKQDASQGTEEVTDPENTDSSPNGWSDDNSTQGNNVISYKDDESNISEGYDFTYDPSKAPDTDNNVDAARVQAFYLTNLVHDFAYQYGFTEETYNFQDDNGDKGGEGGDPVLMSVQDASGTDNANFATPPDGQSGQCRMYIWDYTDPERDGVFQNDIPTHELTHGITNRMTGGGTGRCLQTTEAGGMGEGWSDAMAEWAITSEDIPDFTMGAWVVDNPAGIRSQIYSTDHSTNTLMYSSIQELNEVHDIGEVWAVTLHGVLSALVEDKGFSKTAKTDAGGSEGNVVYAHLFLDALTLQPCNPTMTEARDAWIQADENRYDGENKCTLWKAFADRGLGPNATADYEDDTSVPDDC